MLPLLVHRTTEAERALLAGFLLRRRLFDAEEIALLSAIGKWREPEGGIWVKPPGDPAAPTIYDAIYRDRRVLEPMAALLCDELCDFNYKMITKQKSIAGSKRGEGGSGNHWVWHQVRLREHPGAALKYTEAAPPARRISATGTTATSAGSTRTWATARSPWTGRTAGTARSR